MGLYKIKQQQPADTWEGGCIAIAHGSPKRPKSEINCPSQTPYFLKRVYPRVSKNGKRKIFHSYQKEEIHKTSYSIIKFSKKAKKKI